MTQTNTEICSRLVILFAAMLCVQEKSHAVTYIVAPFSLNNLSLVEGTIETDGTIGSLSASSISQYSITITDGIESATLVGSTSEIIGAVIASETSIVIPVPTAGLFSNLNIPSFQPFETGVIWQVDSEFNQNARLLRLTSAVESLFTQPQEVLVIATRVPEPTGIVLLIGLVPGVLMYRRQCSL